MQDHKKIITLLIQKHMAVLGPDIALSIAKKLPALILAGNGDVLAIIVYPKTALAEINDAYIAFTGELSGMLLASVMKEYHEQ